MRASFIFWRYRDFTSGLFCSFWSLFCLLWNVYLKVNHQAYSCCFTTLGLCFCGRAFTFHFPCGDHVLLRGLCALPEPADQLVQHYCAFHAVHFIGKAIVSVSSGLPNELCCGIRHCLDLSATANILVPRKHHYS